MIDNFNTPSQIARQITEYLNCIQPSIIADFSAGNGELLRHASTRWPNSRIIATDIDKNIVRLLKRKFNKWEVGNCDFLNPISRSRSITLRNIKGKVSLILINPPFSCRGGKILSVNFMGIGYKCSKAMAFLICAIEYLSEKGELFAILPKGTLRSEKDYAIWKTIKRNYTAKVLDSYGEYAFNGCNPKTVLIHIKKKAKKVYNFSLTKDMKSIINFNGFQIYRGNFSVYKLNGCASTKGTPFIHTTNLLRNKLEFNRRILDPPNRIKGPVVLIPRVGEPSKSKIVYYLGREEISLSDCVFAVKCVNRKLAKSVASDIMTNWKKFAELYGGTCAPYLTIKNLSKFLLKKGYA